MLDRLCSVMLRSLPMDPDAQLPDYGRERVIAWVARYVIPHEPAVRRWLRPRVGSPDDADDLIQDAYTKLAGLKNVELIAQPHGYFHQVVRNLLTDHIRRQRIVRIEAVAEIDEGYRHDQEPGPDRIVGGKRDWARVCALIEALPDRCRQIVTLRKIEGLSQREIAERLGVSESIVENDAVKGLRLVMAALKAGEGAPPAPKAGDR